LSDTDILPQVSPNRVFPFFVVDLRRYRESVNTALHSLLVALKAARDAKLDGAKMM
jgi:hypothetical protein